MALSPGTQLAQFEVVAHIGSDGRFLMLKPSALLPDQSGDRVVVLNGFEELKRLVPVEAN